MVKIKFTKGHWDWLAWACVLAILYYLGAKMYHYTNMVRFFSMLVSLTFLLTIVLWLLHKPRSGKRY